MTTIETRVSSQTKRSTYSATAKASKTKSSAKTPSTPVAKNADASEQPHTARVTKHDCVLTLLSQRNGASIPEIMEATGWQQHSVRGFLAGTVKKKLGLALSSSKISDEQRRYRIEARRGRQ